MRPQKIPGKAAPTWSLKMLNRIRVFPKNLALGMKTHTSLENTGSRQGQNFYINHIDIFLKLNTPPAKAGGFT